MEYVLGIDYGTLSARAIVVESKTGRTLGECTHAYAHGVIDEKLPDSTPLAGSGWALAHPADYKDALIAIVSGAIKNAGISSEKVRALAIAATACTLVPVDKSLTPLCLFPQFSGHPHAYAKLWKHHRAQPCADRMTQIAREMEPKMLERYGGRISSEWAIPKIMEIYYEDSTVYHAASRFMQISDWLTAWLTGCGNVQNGSIAQYKSMWNRQCGWPSDEYLSRVDNIVPEIIHAKLGGQMLMAGERVGTLTENAAQMLGLQSDTVVAMAHTDAHCGALGAGASREGDYVLILGTSSCGHLISRKSASVPGVTGAINDGLLPGYICYSAGQASVGDMLSWLIQNAVPGKYADLAQAEGKNLYQFLENLAAAQRPGQCGLIALDWFNGNRSILANANLSGVLMGLTLESTPEDIYRALLDSIAFGHREIVDNFYASGLEINRIILCGGIVNQSRLLPQILSDVLNRPVEISVEPQATALGAAMCAAAAADKIPLTDAIDRMKGQTHIIISPNPENAQLYERIYALYHRLYRFFGKEEPDLMAQLYEE